MGRDERKQFCNFLPVSRCCGHHSQSTWQQCLIWPHTFKMASNRGPNFKIVCCNLQCNVKAKLCMETKYLIRENLINWTRDDIVCLSVFVFSGADGGPLLPAGGGPMQLSHEPMDLENSKKYFCRVKIFRRHHPGAGSRFTIALRVWLLPRQSLPLWCQLTARPGGGAIGKQRQAPVSCSAVDKLRSNSKLTLVHRQRLVEKRKMQKPFKERRSYGEHLVVFQICQGCEILKFMQTPFQWKMQWGQIENISTMLKVRNSRLSVAPWISLRIQSLGCWEYWLAASAMNSSVFLFAW